MTVGDSRDADTLFLRLEGALQAWGDNSKFVVRRTMGAPTKSGVLGLVCCAAGLSRARAGERLGQLNELSVGVRLDRAGAVWPDYQTVGAGIGIRKADGKGIKRTATTKQIETLVTRRYYLCDASFLVALHGTPERIAEVHSALSRPRWPVYLGRKCCPPSVPLVYGDVRDLGTFEDVKSALASRPWQPRCAEEEAPGALECLIEWRATQTEPIAPAGAEVWYDVPEGFDPPVHHARFVIRDTLTPRDGLRIQQQPSQRPAPRPPRTRADYRNQEYKARRRNRLKSDNGLCVFCKSPATTAQHVTYRRAGGDEAVEDLRSLCRLCHDAVTIIEYGLGMGLDRVNPEDPQWRASIIAKRDEIVRFRSLETRRRRLSPKDVE